MARKKSILEDLCALPWWVSVATSAVVYLFLKWILPALTSGHAIATGLSNGVTKLAPLFALIFLLPAPISFLISIRKKKQLDKQTGIDSIRLLDWNRFEELLGEIFRRKGYRVIENHEAGPDGGIDLRLIKNGETVLVQCKQWRAQKVGVGIVRELYGVMAADGAPKGIVVTSGKFTKDAKAFAFGKAVMLIDGEKLEPLLNSVKNNVQEVKIPLQKVAHKVAETNCPKCGKEMVLRTAKKGQNAGNKFWGCSGYPGCRSIVNI